MNSTPPLRQTLTRANLLVYLENLLLSMNESAYKSAKTHKRRMFWTKVKHAITGDIDLRDFAFARGPITHPFLIQI